MKLILIRHLPTEYNRIGLLQGRRDEPIALPSAGVIFQIRENRKTLDTMAPFDVVIASSLGRTAMTAKHYGFANPIRDPLLDELDFGPFEGRPRADLMAEDGKAWLENPYQSLLGEFVRDLEARVRGFVATYSIRGTVLGFAHGCWIRALLSVIRHGNVADMNRFDVPNNSLTVLDVQEFAVPPSGGSCECGDLCMPAKLEGSGSGATASRLPWQRPLRGAEPPEGGTRNSQFQI